MYHSQPWFNLNVPWPARVYKICTLEFGFEVRWFHGTYHLYPLELPSKTDEQITMMDNRRSEDDVTENDYIYNQEQYSTKHDKKRKVHLIARQRIHQCLRDNPTSILFALPGGCRD